MKSIPAKHLTGALAALALLLPATAGAQNISLKTVPIPTGEQFLLFPSARLGMGGVHLSIDDPLAAPFSNPARRLASGSAYLYATPTFYGETNGQVGGRSLPISAAFAGRKIHGAFGLALQQVDHPPSNIFLWEQGGGSNLLDNARDNTYMFGSIGAALGDATSVGVSVFQADLGAVDGVALLYARSVAIDQDGELTEIRAGLAHDFGEDRRLEGTITNTRLDMTHDVQYVEWRWDREPPFDPPTTRRWSELNEDRTTTWGTYLKYRQPLNEDARIGWLLAASTKAHPKIPNYNIVNIPRDPGNSTVFNLGVGLSRVEGPMTVGVDVVFEPGRSHTWAYADTVTTLPSGKRLQPGDKTIDNEFDFRNWSIAMGADREGERFGFQLGLRVRQTNYDLFQQNFLREQVRKTDESWMEWAPSWGAVAHFGGIDLRYTGRFTAKGFQAPVFFGRAVATAAAEDMASGVDFVVGATDPVLMPDYRVTVHRFTLSMQF